MKVVELWVTMFGAETLEFIELQKDEPYFKKISLVRKEWKDGRILDPDHPHHNLMFREVQLFTIRENNKVEIILKPEGKKADRK